MFIVGVAIVGTLALLALQAVANRHHLLSLGALPRGSRRSVAVLIPARNEAAGIGTAVRAWLAQRYAPFTVIVYDDDSSDDTATIARASAAGDARLHVVAGGRLPAGWGGKPHACHRLRAVTDAEILVFADVDVVPSPGVLTHTVGGLEATGADALSALPRHDADGVVMRALVGLQRWAAQTLVPWWLARRGRIRALSVVNGQFIAIRAGAYDATGGFAAVATSLAEDVALGRRLVVLGRTAIFVDGAELLRCRPYVTFPELWSANVRNLAGALLGSSLLAVGGATALIVLYVAPVVTLFTGPAWVPAWPWSPLAAVILGVLPRWLAGRNTGEGLSVAALHPFAIAVLAAMIVESWRRARLGHSVEWRGRRYRASDATG